MRMNGPRHYLRSIAPRWLTQRKSPGKFCREAAVSALPE
jgi:hypothetical protein